MLSNISVYKINYMHVHKHLPDANLIYRFNEDFKKYVVQLINLNSFAWFILRSHSVRQSIAY